MKGTTTEKDPDESTNLKIKDGAQILKNRGGTDEGG